jgi:peptide/nickel transport system substrate-binding protein
VRQAVSAAIDREAIINTIYGRTARPTSNVLVAPEEYRSPNTSSTFAPARAEALLAESGWNDTNGDGVRERDGEPLRIVYQASDEPLSLAIMQLVRQNLGAVGFAVEPAPVKNSTLVSVDRQHVSSADLPTFDMRQYVVSSRTPDPALYMGRWTCDEIPGPTNENQGTNVIGWCNAIYEQLYEQAQSEMNTEARRALFMRMNDLLVNDGFVIPVAHLADVSGIHNRLRGYVWTPWDAEVWQIENWQRTNTP